MNTAKILGIISGVTLAVTLTTGANADVGAQQAGVSSSRVIAVVDHSALGRTLATNTQYHVNPQASYKWSRPASAESTEDSWSATAPASAGYKWSSRGGQPALGGGSYNTGDVFAATMSAPQQAGYRWGTKSHSVQTGYRWGTKGFTDQTGYRWGTKSNPNQSGYRWGTKGLEAQK